MREKLETGSPSLGTLLNGRDFSRREFGLRRTPQERQGLFIPKLKITLSNLRDLTLRALGGERQRRVVTRRDYHVHLGRQMIQQEGD
jgi:hypothetical protein